MSKTIGEAYNEIINKVIEILNAERVEGGKLEGVKRIIRGDRTKGVIKPPVIWVYQDQITSEEITSRKERKTLPLILVAVYQSNDPEKGHINSTDLVDKALNIVLKDRQLGGFSYIYDIKSGPFEPSSPLFADESGVYGAGATVNILFDIIRD
ncbi:hypothetical protein [Virgibacillus sp. SK37]|uniref:hypothetical protein n=1 Tax=Virgibacillus sp. SK37 TaxID=403957 RepID=UPI0004D0E0E6|nr:hypothetical protein [Virgibacillus sp. SK37]AIF45645.1 hypothetical protein X953_18815 [Virgibacillus sp. SK37]